MRNSRARGLFTLGLVLTLLTTAVANAAGLLIAEGGFGGLLEIQEHKVNVTINNGIAVTEVDQTFLNTEGRTVEALYMFPVPEGASVANFSMWINGNEMIGEVVEKERAREIYESYKRVNRDPGLLEQTDFKTFEMRIFPIAAGAEQRVKISYYQQLDVDHDRATYVYPLSTTSRRDIDQRTTGEFSFGLRVLSPVEIVSMKSPSHKDDFVFALHGENFHEASLETEKGDLSRDIVLTYSTSRPKTGVDIITSSPQGEDGYFMATLTAGEELDQANEPMDYVFILDISGSMKHGQKLGLSRKSIDAFVKNLAPEDRFELIAFNLQPLSLFGELRQADESAITEATGFLNSQEAKGGTILAPAMQSAYKYGEPDRRLNVVILSDGMAEQKERSELLRLIRQRPENATVFAIGVGNDVDRPLLTQLAESAGGLADFISKEDNFQRQSESFRRKLTRPAATNVKIEFDGVEAYNIVPEEIPNLYHGKPVHVFGRFRRGDEFRVKTAFEVNGRPMTSTSTHRLSPRDNPEIERMWAWNRVQKFQNLMRRSGEDESTIDEIVDLGEMYSIVTRYTSFLVLENNDEYQRWKIRRRNEKRLSRDRRNHADLAEELNRLRDNSLAGLGPKRNRNLRSKADQTAQSQPNGPSFQPSTNTYNTPEPSSRLLMLIGMLVLIMRRLRTRQQ